LKKITFFNSYIGIPVVTPRNSWLGYLSSLDNINRIQQGSRINNSGLSIWHPINYQKFESAKIAQQSEGLA